MIRNNNVFEIVLSVLTTGKVIRLIIVNYV